MSLPRLPFLYPHIFNSARAWEACATVATLPRIHRPRLQPVQRRCARRLQGSYTQRYGPAAEPGLPPPKAGAGEAQERNEPAPVSSSSPNRDRDRGRKDDSGKKKEQKKQAKPSPTEATEKKASQSPKPRIDADTQPDRPLPKPSSPTSSLEPAIVPEANAAFAPSSAPGLSDVDTAAATPAAPEQSSSPESHPPLESVRLGTSRPLEKVLYMEAPRGMDATGATGTALETYDGHHKPPHLHTPPYVHHFDTYTLVKDLGKSGFTQEQSVTIMKAIRGFLAVNLDMAKEGLVSKSDVENETYLFRAASSELRTEIQNARRRTSDAQRSDRAHLQHDADILAQEVTGKTQTLRDELKGMFDDRKMAVRGEQRGMDSAIQEINRKITVALLGEGKGEVEALRWFLTRRVAMFIGFAAVCTIAYMRYTTYIAHLEEQARERSAKSGRGGGGGDDLRGVFGSSTASVTAALVAPRSLVNAADSDLVMANAAMGGDSQRGGGGGAGGGNGSGNGEGEGEGGYVSLG